jgi:dihydrofolate reductase
MAKLIYTAITSLDGYIADEDGNFDWAAPDEEVHTFVNDLERPVGTYLYGRRMYEVMVYWETAHTLPDRPPVEHDFAAIWQAADKIVYSKTLETVSSAKTRLERAFDPEAVRQLKASAGRDLTVGGPDLAARPSRPGWSTSATCSSRPSWWEAATRRSPTMSGCGSNCWRNAVSATAWCTSATAPGREGTATLPGRLVALTLGRAGRFSDGSPAVKGEVRCPVPVVSLPGRMAGLEVVKRKVSQRMGSSSRRLPPCERQSG